LKHSLPGRDSYIIYINDATGKKVPFYLTRFSVVVQEVRNVLLEVYNSDNPGTLEDKEKVNYSHYSKFRLQYIMYYIYSILEKKPGHNSLTVLQWRK
jgi:hypothetical protein